MKVFDGQVHVFELLAVAVIAFLTYSIGYSLPLLAAILFLTWPLLLIQMLGEGAVWVLILSIRKLWRRGEPVPPPPVVKRRGVARSLWLAPFVTMAVGYLIQYRDTGTWFL
ncbi:MAG: hypothetical protein ACSHWS_14720 [Sulfitobacter sp.]